MVHCKKTLGKDAIVSMLLRYIHPSEHVRSKYTNPLPNQSLENFTVLHQEVKKISGRNQLAIIICHPDFMDGDTPIELYAMKRWFKVQEEGPADFFFTVPAGMDNTEVPERIEQDAKQEMLAIILQLAERGARVKMHDLLGIGVMVDDDEEPVPENIPGNTPPNNDVVYNGWSRHQNICPCRLTIRHKKQAKIDQFPCDVLPTVLQLFELFFPMEFVKDVMLPKMNERLEEEQAITYGKWLCFIGLWFLMATTFSSNHHDFWANSEPDMFTGIPWQLGHFMSRYCFDKILSSLYFTDRAPPQFRD